MTEREHYLQILRLHDDPQRWEYPRHYDYDAARTTFLAFAHAVQVELNVVCRVETDSLIQDASFIGQVVFPDDVLVQSGPHDYGGRIRVSNFGKMATVASEAVFPPPMLAALQHIMARVGYVYIPPTVLDEPYTGSNPGVTGIATWWIRYFDWV